MDEFRQLSIKKHRGLQLIKISSEGDRPLLSAGLLFSDLGYWTLDESLIGTLLYCCLLAEPTSLSKKKMFGRSKKTGARNGSWSDSIAFENISDQTQVRSKRLWSNPIALEVASDQTQVRSNPPMIRLFRPNWPLIRPSPDHGPDCSAHDFPSRPCNFGLGTHGYALDWVWS